LSGRGLLTRDPFGSHWILAAASSDEVLGGALLDALARSRFVESDEARALLDRAATKSSYEAWVQELFRFHSYKSRRALFKHMSSCNIKRIDTEICIEPTTHVKLEAWEGLGQEATVIVSSDERPVRLGEALRRAFDRCG
jgi:hypothetical protein